MAVVSVTTWKKNPSSLSALQTRHKNLMLKINAHHQLIPLFLTLALTMTSAPSLTVPQPLQRMQRKTNCSCIPERYQPKILRRAYLSIHCTGLHDGKWLQSSQRSGTWLYSHQKWLFQPSCDCLRAQSKTIIFDKRPWARYPSTTAKGSSCVTPAIDWN